MPTTGRCFTLAVTLIAVLCFAPQPAGLSVPTALAQGFDHSVLSRNTQTYRPRNEASQTNDTVLKLTDAWEKIMEHPPPGETYLPRGGTYNINTTLLMSVGRLDQSMAIKPYTCEAVTLKSTYSCFSTICFIVGDSSTNAPQLL